MQPVVTVGQVFKNYKEMCGYLGLPIMKSNSKKSQLKHLSQYFTLEKNGQELKIVDVIKPIYCKDDFQKDSDILDEYVETLLLQYFINHERIDIYISKTKLWETLGMVNKDYFTAEYEAINNEYHRYHNYYFKEWIFNNFKSRVNQINSNKLHQTLDHLQKRRLINWRKVYVEINSDGHYIVDNPAKEQFIMSCERKAIDDVFEHKPIEQHTNNGDVKERQSNISDIYRLGLYKKYNRKLNEYLKEKDILGIYRKYHIVVNEKDLLEEALTINCNSLCRKINERIVNLIDKGADSEANKYAESKTDIAEIQKWLTHRLIYLGWHIEHFFDKPIEEDNSVADIEKDIPWKQTA